MRPALVHVWRALRMNWSDGDEPETSKVTFRLNINIGDVLDCFQGVDVWRVEEQFEDALRTTMTQVRSAATARAQPRLTWPRAVRAARRRRSTRSCTC